MLVFLKYFARSMVDGSAAADAMFDEMVALAETWVAAHHEGQIRDTHAYAVVLIAMELGSLVMRYQLSRTLGTDVFEREGHLRLLRAKVDFYSEPLLSPDFAHQVHDTLDHLERSHPVRTEGSR